MSIFPLNCFVWHYILYPCTLVLNIILYIGARCITYIYTYTYIYLYTTNLLVKMGASGCKVVKSAITYQKRHFILAPTLQGCYLHPLNYKLHIKNWGIFEVNGVQLNYL